MPWDNGRKQVIKHLFEGWDSGGKNALKVGTVEERLGTVEENVGTVEEMQFAQTLILQGLQQISGGSPLFPRILP